jgi:hypothetical protein
MEASSKVTPKWNILKAINTGGEGGGDTDGDGDDAGRLCHS